VEVHSILAKSRKGQLEQGPALCRCLRAEQGEGRQEAGQGLELYLSEVWLHGDCFHCLHLMFTISNVLMNVFSVIF